MSMPLLTILLATYNGERFLASQLDSLWQQSFQDFELIVRDDGSSDATVRLLKEAQAKRPGQVKLIIDNKVRLGPKGSFAELLRNASTPYVAFCDQDDYWLPCKLERLIEAIRSEERKFGSSIPILCCSDAKVTDSELNVTDVSYFDKHKISVSDGRDLALPRLIFRNYAIGATTMINAPLVELCKQIPDEAIMHDWWCALVACILGRTVTLNEPLVLYRQHGSNAVGSRRRALPRTKAQALDYLNWSRTSSARCINQAIALRRALNKNLDKKSDAFLARYASFAAQSALQRAVTVLSTRAFKPGILLNGLHLYACMTANYDIDSRHYHY